ncbi:hypothetical protein SCAR479_13620 [Seiridium cardinale]|uniref:Uncharacterized protein n=1 Tax=Seiridium cardinale TaxID=138064 RepID=A0ABR2X7D2_9PEZI
MRIFEVDSLVSLTGCRQQKTQESAAKQKPTRGGTPKRQTPTGTPRWTKKTAASDLQALFGVAEETSEPDTTERQTGREDESEPEDEAALASALEKAYRGNIFQKLWKWGVRAKCLLHTPGRMSLKRKSEYVILARGFKEYRDFQWVWAVFQRTTTEEELVALACDTRDEYEMRPGSDSQVHHCVASKVKPSTVPELLKMAEEVPELGAGLNNGHDLVLGLKRGDGWPEIFDSNTTTSESPIIWVYTDSVSGDNSLVNNFGMLNRYSGIRHIGHAVVATKSGMASGGQLLGGKFGYLLDASRVVDTTDLEVMREEFYWLRDNSHVIKELLAKEAATQETAEQSSAMDLGDQARAMPEGTVAATGSAARLNLQNNLWAAIDDTINKTVTEVRESKGALKRETATVQETLGGNCDLLRAQVDSLKTSMDNGCTQLKTAHEWYALW